MIRSITSSKKKREDDLDSADGNTPTFALDGRYQLASGVLYLNGDFCKEVIQPIVASIMEYNMMPAEIQPNQIILYINSHGGRMDQCMSLIDTINSSAIPVTTVASGTLASAGFMVFMSGHKRLVSSTAILMSHIYSGGNMGSHYALEAARRHQDHVFEMQVTLYRRMTGLSRKKVLKHLLPHQDVWLTPAEAVKFGVADEIIDFYEEREITLKEIKDATKKKPVKYESESAIKLGLEDLTNEELANIALQIKDEVERRVGALGTPESEGGEKKTRRRSSRKPSGGDVDESRESVD